MQQAKDTERVREREALAHKTNATALAAQQQQQQQWSKEILKWRTGKMQFFLFVLLLQLCFPVCVLTLFRLPHPFFHAHTQ